MSPEEIRAEYVETLAAWYASLEGCSAVDCSGCRKAGELAADALAAEGKLPTAVDARYIGRGVQRRTRYVTEWQDPSNVSEFPKTSHLESGGQTKQMPPRPSL